MNNIIGSSRAIKDTLPPQYLRKFKKILIKYNLLYQEQFIFSNGFSFCSWNQFRQRCFTLHINTQKPPKFYHELQILITNNTSYHAQSLPEYDQDIGRTIE